MLRSYQNKKARPKDIVVECKLADGTIERVQLPFMPPGSLLDRCRHKWGPGWLLVLKDGTRQWKLT